MAKDRIEVITSVEWHRRWGAEDKAHLVAAMNEPGAVVTEIARGAGVDASLLYRWRRHFAQAVKAVEDAFRAAANSYLLAPVRDVQRNQVTLTPF